jgi:CheY-like chemotaxis protein
VKTILVVDDEEAIRLLYQEELQEAGYRVLTAADGATALALVAQARPDLITLDIRMPGMDGIDLLRRVREGDRRIPIVISTAYGEYKWSDFGVWAADAYVTKSSDLTELLTKIRELLPLG